MPYKDLETAKKYARQYQRKWRKKRRAHVRKKNREWRRDHPQKAKVWRATNKDRFAEYTRRYRERHPIKAIRSARKSDAKRRARIGEKKKRADRELKRFWRGREDLQKLYEAIKAVNKKLKNRNPE